MDNRILDVSVEDRSLDPVSAEVWVTVTPEHLTPTTEVRGRLTGPSCPYSSTVEIAYPLTPLRRPEDTLPGALRLRVVIPEPSFWDTQSPFLYAGPVELWQDGQRCDRIQVRHGLRQLRIGARGALLNGKPLVLRGRAWEAGFAQEIPTLHQQGCNAMLAPVREDTAALWDLADRAGLLILGRVEKEEGTTVHLLQRLGRHPCCFGWVAGQGWLADERLHRLLDLARSKGGPFVGVEVRHLPVGQIPDGIHFLLAREDTLPALAETGLPVLALGGPGRQESPPQPTFLGRVEGGPA